MDKSEVIERKAESTSPTEGPLRPAFVLEEFFSGPLSGWGVMMSRGGSVKKQFFIHAEGEWHEAARELRLTEEYYFDDGHRDTLHWIIRKRGVDTYSGKEPRVIGTADGVQRGNHFQWRYRRDMPQKGGGSIRLSFSDHFLLMTPARMLATATVTKFGFRAASLAVIYEKTLSQTASRRTRHEQAARHKTR